MFPIPVQEVESGNTSEDHESKEEVSQVRLFEVAVERHPNPAGIRELDSKNREGSPRDIPLERPSEQHQGEFEEYNNQHELRCQQRVVHIRNFVSHLVEDEAADGHEDQQVLSHKSQTANNLLPGRDLSDHFVLLRAPYPELEYYALDLLHVNTCPREGVRCRSK